MMNTSFHSAIVNPYLHSNEGESHKQGFKCWRESLAFRQRIAWMLKSWKGCRIDCLAVWQDVAVYNLPKPATKLVESNVLLVLDRTRVMHYFQQCMINGVCEHRRRKL